MGADDEFITKKELLEETGLSYGQLYRWKRMQLIPESWFIKRSAFTGQETVFPRGKILERVARIQDLKDRYSLEELADLLSPEWGTKRYEPQVLARLRLPTRIPPWLRDLRAGANGQTPSESGATSAITMKFSDLVALALDEELKGEGVVRAAHEVAVRAVATGLENADKLDERDDVRVVVVTLRENGGRLLGVVVAGSAQLRFFPQVEVQVDRSLTPVIERVRNRLQGWTD